MRAALLAGTVLLAAAVVQPACARQQEPAGSAEELYRTGRYEEAAAALRSATEPAARRLLVRVLLESGRYEDAERAALNGSTAAAVPAELANVLGEALYARGRREEAERAFARAVEGESTDALQARLNLAIARWERGARAEALADFDAFIDIYNNGTARTADDLTAVATAVAYLGVTDPQLFHDAVRAYEEAARVDPSNPLPKLREGALFLAKYSSTEASALFRDVLAINPRHPEALLGLARAKAFDGSDEALALVDSSLAVNPAAPAARTFRAQLLLGLEDYDGARQEAERALDVNPAYGDALAMLGAVHFLRGDERAHAEMRRRALELDPAYGAFDVMVAEMAAQHRRYAQAVEIARRGVALDSTNWSGHALIGLTELRLGNVEAARNSLDIAFRGDPYNVWVKNTLDLLDTYPQYVTRTTPRFELFLHGDEADVLELYMAELSEEAYEQLSQRYGARPETPVRVEVYPRHADFSVRSVGLAGLGALGIAFGNILALDSPAARDPGDFNWGSTLWHEIAHAVTLAASRHRVPRWLTEGISVLEERRARPGWGEAVSPDFLAALKSGQMLPVSELNAGFVRPKYPQQIMHAYYQASLVAEMIEDEHGERALRDMLRAYGDGRTHDEVLRSVLRTEPAAFDEQFDRHLREKFATQLAAIDVPAGADHGGGSVQLGGAFLGALRGAEAALDAGNTAIAVREAERARDMYPEYAGVDGPYMVLYRAAIANRDTAAAIAALRAHVLRRESDYDGHVTLADLLAEAGDARGAADMLERAMYIHPYDAAVHERMAELYAATGQHAKSVRERRAILALNPVNRADAHYRLAAALFEAGDRTQARREVLRALEIAPNFADAQTLLLRLQEGS
ncbi:MAG TPA: tetratricopeptide repeat protein [Longimicrobiales bacterium]|nr:tetratricopeptide repeat protein [Longimicrobiales bacterium]